MTTGVAPISQANTRTPASPATPSDATAKLASQDVFLKLLVAQISHQNPLQPADGLQFISQLAQFTSLEQQMQMKQDLRAIRDALEPAAQAAAPSANPEGVDPKNLFEL